MKVEYRVRPVTRYVVTRWHEGDRNCGSESLGEFENETQACNAALAFSRFEGNDNQVVGHEVDEIALWYSAGGSDSVDRWVRGKGWSSANVVAS